MNPTSLLKRIPAPLLILVIGLIVVIALATLKPSPKPLPEEAADPILVEVVKVESKTMNLTVHSQGTVAPKREIELVAEVAGRVTLTSDNFVSGGFATTGELLVQIDPRDYQLAQIQADARVKEAEQLLATERGRARQAKREWRNLGNTDANDLFLRKPQLASAEAQVAAAKADLAKAELNVERSRITLPFDGRIRTTKVNLGQYVTPGTSVAQVFDTDTAEIRLALTDREAALLALPLSALPTNTTNNDAEQPEVIIRGVVAGKELEWKGKITRTDASLDTRSRFYYAVAEIEQPFIATKDMPTPLIAGLFVDAEITGRELSDVIKLPKSALFKNNQLYLVDEENRIQQAQVNILQTNSEHAWIQGDIKNDSQVVLNKQRSLMPGVTVQIQGEQ